MAMMVCPAEQCHRVTMSRKTFEIAIDLRAQQANPSALPGLISAAAPMASAGDCRWRPSIRTWRPGAGYPKVAHGRPALIPTERLMSRRRSESIRLQHRQFLDKLISGHFPTVAEIVEISQRTGLRESIHLDYKSGRIVNQKDASGEAKPKWKPLWKLIAGYICGFGNAEGGVLVVGVGEEKDPDSGVVNGRPIDPIPRSRDQVEEQVERAAEKLRTFFPRGLYHRIVECDGGCILLVATDRIDSLAFLVDQARPIHYLRIGDSTFEAPRYLIEDLVSGRRQRPDLIVSGKSELAYAGESYTTFRLRVSFEVVNSSLSWAQDVRVGLVYAEQGKPRGLPSILAAHIQTVGTDPRLMHKSLALQVDSVRAKPPVDLAPFASLVAWDNSAIPLLTYREADMRPSVIMFMALYLVAKNLSPQWWQIVVAHRTCAAPHTLSVHPSSTRGAPMVGTLVSPEVFAHGHTPTGWQAALPGLEVWIDEGDNLRVRCPEPGDR